MDFIWRCGWLKNPAIWLAENILAHTQKPKFFLIWNLCRNRANNINFITAQTYAKFFPQIQKPLFLVRFWFIFPIFGISIFSGKSGSLTHNFMWFSSTILKFRKNWWQNPKKMPGQKDGRADRPYFIGPFWLPRGSKKSGKETGTNFVLLSPSRNLIWWFIKDYLHEPIKVLQFLSSGKIKKCLRNFEIF